LSLFYREFNIPCNLFDVRLGTSLLLALHFILFVSNSTLNKVKESFFLQSMIDTWKNRFSLHLCNYTMLKSGGFLINRFFFFNVCLLMWLLGFLILTRLFVCWRINVVRQNAFFCFSVAITKIWVGYKQRTVECVWTLERY
jgi:hypothetical protein